MGGDDDDRRLLNGGDTDDSGFFYSGRAKVLQPISLQELLNRKWHKSLKMGFIALCFGLACAVSLGSWYYLIGEKEVGIKDSALGIMEDAGKEITTTPATECAVVKSATEYYSPGQIRPTSDDTSLPRTFLWPIEDMVKLREYSKVKSGYTESWGRPHRRTLMWLRRNVYDTLDEGKLYSVIDQKMTPRSGTKNDYQSMGFYWWPCTQALEVCGLTVPDFYRKTCDPATDLPWVLCDGKDNEKTRDYSSKNSMQLMSWDATELGLLYWYTRDEAYAKRAKELLRHFFLEPKTAMTPHLEYAQWVPGLEEFDEVNGYGIIEVKDWSELLDAVALLRESPNWDPELDDKPLMEWFRKLLAWMMASHKGNIERHHHNNHAVWFYQTAMSIALHVGDVYTARLLAYDVPQMIDHQIMRDGTLPLELERPRKIHYTCYAMSAFYRLARLTEAVGVKAFNHNTTSVGLNPPGWNHMKQAMKFVLPYMQKKEKFPYPDTDVEKGRKGAIWQRCLEPLAMAQLAWPDDEELQKAMGNAVEQLVDDYFIEPRVYGQPVFALYDMFKPGYASARAGDAKPGDKWAESAKSQRA